MDKIKEFINFLQEVKALKYIKRIIIFLIIFLLMRSCIQFSSEQEVKKRNDLISDHILYYHDSYFDKSKIYFRENCLRCEECLKKAIKEGKSTEDILKIRGY